MSEASVEIFYPWLDSKNSPAHAWCTGGDILFVFLSIPPFLAVVETQTIPFDVSPAIWGGSHGFTSGVVKDTVAACEASLGFRQMEFYFSSVFFSPCHLFVCLRVQGTRCWLENTEKRKDHMLLEEILLMSFPYLQRLFESNCNSL